MCYDRYNPDSVCRNSGERKPDRRAGPTLSQAYQMGTNAQDQIDTGAATKISELPCGERQRLALRQAGGNEPGPRLRTAPERSCFQASVGRGGGIAADRLEEEARRR